MTRLFSILFLVLPIWAQPGGAPPRAPVDPGSAVLGGTVLDRVTRAPIRKALVRLMGGRTSDVRAVTGSTGRFLFRDLDAGSYSLRVEHPAYPEDVGFLRRERTQRVQLGKDEEKTDIEFLLTPGASISGRVLDEDGEPVVWCGIDLLQLIMEGGVKRMRRAGSDQTNERGEYRINDVAPGRYFVRVRAHRRLPAARPFAPADAVVPVSLETYPTLFYPGVTTLTEAGTVTLRPGVEARGVDFELHRTPAVQVLGRVAAADAGALARQYSAQLVQRDELLGWAAQTFATGVRKSSGRFRFAQPIPSGSYWLHIQGDDHGPRYFAHVAVDIAPGPPVELVVPLTRLPSVRGRVQIEADEKRDFLVTGLSLRPLRQGRWRHQISAKVDEDGRFLFDDVLPGRWSLQADVNGQGYVKWIRAGGRQMQPGDLIIPAGGGPELLVEVGTQMGWISGTLDRSAEWVILLPATDEPRPPDKLRMANAADGRFDLGAVEPGDYRLFAVPAGITDSPYDLMTDPDVFDAVLFRAVSVTVAAHDKITATVPLIPTDVFSRSLVQ